MKISNAGAGHLVGLEDVVNQRKTTVNFRCVGCEGVLLTIEQRYFLKIVKRDKQLWNLFAQVCQNKDSVTLRKLSQSKVAFQSFVQDKRERSLVNRQGTQKLLSDQQLQLSPPQTDKKTLHFKNWTQASNNSDTEQADGDWNLGSPSY